MTANFLTRKQVHKIFRRPKTHPTRLDIRQLRHDPDIQGNYSAKIDSLLLGDTRMSSELEDVEGPVTDEVLTAS